MINDEIDFRFDFRFTIALIALGFGLFFEIIKMFFKNIKVGVHQWIKKIKR